MRKGLLGLFFLAFTTLLHSQPWAYDFGTGTGTANNTNSGSGLTTFFSTTVSPATATPTNGGTYRVRIGTAGGSLVVANPGTSLGSQSEVQLTAATSTSTNKFGVYDWSSASTVGYVKFKLRTTSAGNGNLNFSFGINTVASDNQGFTIHYNNSLVSFRINYSGGSISSVQRRTSGADNTITSSGISKDADQLIEIYANNGSSSSNYFRGSVQYTLATQTWDMWVDGSRIVSGAAKAGTLASATNLSGFCFFAESSTSNAAVIYLDDFEYSNSLPSTAFSLTNDYFRSKATGNWSSTSTWESSSDNSTWINATLTPDNNANTISIQAGHTVTLDANTSVSNTTIAATGALNVAPGVVLTVPLGKLLTTNDKLTLQSSNSGTASIGNSAGTIVGNVTVQTYIPPNRRAYRFLSHPFSTTLTMGRLVDNIFITGDGTTTGLGGVSPATGFDATTTNAASSWWFDNTTNVWKAFTDSADASWAQYRGARVLIRGDRTQTTTLTSATPPAPNAVTLDVTGILNVGPQNISLPNANNFHFIGNPYASPVDIGTVIAANSSNLGALYYVWDPQSGNRGAYVNKSTTGGAFSIPANSAFIVLPTTVTSLSFAESNKTASASNTNSFFRTNSSSGLVELKLLYNNYPADNIFLRLNASSSDNKEILDGTKLNNPDFNLYVLSADNQQLSLDTRPFAENKIIPLGISSVSSASFTLTVADYGINEIIYLKDKFLNTTTLLSAGTTYTFSVDLANTATLGENRFELVMRSSNALPVTFLSVSAAQKNGGIEVNWNTANETNMISYEVEESADGINFSKATTVAAKNAATNNYNWFDATINNGDNFYRIKSIEQNGASKYSNVVKVKVGGKNTEFTVYPNPVKGGVVNLQMTNAEKGIYTVKIYNKVGQELASKSINHNGGSASQTIQLSAGIASGSYSMQISNGTTVITKTVIVE